MNYLSKVLGINVSYERSDLNHYPNFICTRYCLRIVSLECQRVVFLYPKTELERIETLKKHIERIKNTEKRIFGIGRVFHAEYTECQMLCGRKNLSMERCYVQ